MRWIGQLAVALDKNGGKRVRRVTPAPGTSSPGARRREGLRKVR
jgi:hypothetical protein